jgi:glycine betaine/choline ABC-type transport system substrate-binding protein
MLLAGCSRERYVAIASKNFTEQYILGEVVAQHVENRLHRPVQRKFGLGGTMLAQAGLLAREIDVYPEYTGTAFTNVMKHKPTGDPDAVLKQLRQDYAQWKLEWLDPFGFNNSFAMAVRGVDARGRHLETLSDAARDPKGFALGAGYEFMGRPDGYPMLNGAYGIKWTGSPKAMDLGLLYRALEQGQVSMVAGSVTDAQLAVVDAKVLADDKHVFPPYQACLVARQEAFTEFPGLRDALLDLSGKITDNAMRKMNYEVDGKHRQSAEVAREFLKQHGL